MKIYLACGLTHVPRDIFSDYCDFLHRLAERLRSEPAKHEVNYALINSDPHLAEKPFEERARLCYLWDREIVEEADLIIAEASFPAIGLGIELQIAEANDTPILLCFRDYQRNRALPVKYINPDCTSHSLQIGEGYVSLMALGLPAVYRVIRYDDCEVGLRKIIEVVRVFLRE